MTQDTPGGVAGFRCQRCQTDVQRIRCSKCSGVTNLYGTLQGGGAIEFRCAHCHRKRVVSKQQLRAINSEVRRATRAVAAMQRQAVVSERQAKVEHAQRRQFEMQAMNAQLESYASELTNLLWNSLIDREQFGFHSLRLEPEFAPFTPGPLAVAEPSPDLGAFMPEAPSGLAGRMPGARKRYEALVADAESRYRAVQADWNACEASRKARLAAALADHDARAAAAKSSVDAHNRAIEELRSGCERREADAVIEYFSGPSQPATTLRGSHRKSDSHTRRCHDNRSSSSNCPR